MTSSPGRASEESGLTPFQGLYALYQSTGGYASLHHRLPSTAPLALRSSPAESGKHAYPGFYDTKAVFICKHTGKRAYSGLLRFNGSLRTHARWEACVPRASSRQGFDQLIDLFQRIIKMRRDA